MKNLASLLALLLISTATTLAQRVVDLSGNGIQAVEVKCVVSCQQTAGPIVTATEVTTTDTEGRFGWPLPGAPGGTSGCQQSVSYSYTLKKEGYMFTRSAFRYRPPSLLPGAYDDRLNLIQGTHLPAWANVSAASFVNDQLIASEMILAGFGADLALSTVIATEPLPTTLADRRVLVKDFMGVEKAAKLLFVSPGQINYVTPEGLANGPAQIRLVDENSNLIRIGLAEIKTLAPAIFSANADGKGVPAAVVVRVKPGNVQNYEPVAEFDQQQQRFVPLALDLGPEDEFLVLSLFGTGWRRASQINTSVKIGGIDCPVEYVGKQPTIEGLDQINARLPRALIGRGEVDVFVSFGSPPISIPSDYFVTNAVRLKFK